MIDYAKISRRTVLAALAASAAGTALPSVISAASAGARPQTRPIPSTGEAMPIVGLGSWITFNVGNDPKLLAECTDVMRAFFAGGGRMIDCSPMYGSSQDTIGHGLEKLGHPEPLFSAEKVWTSWPSRGPSQIATTRSKWGVPKFDLVQVHNLAGLDGNLDTLEAMKAQGDLRYIGVTTSHGRRHGDLEQVMKSRPLDFVQLTYNILDREAEARLLPLAAERGIGVIVNRPYRRGALIERFKNKPLPPWAGEIGARSWAQFLLKFIISHPDITVAIPATRNVAHVEENLAAASGPLPDAGMRQRMADYARAVG